VVQGKSRIQKTARGAQGKEGKREKTKRCSEKRSLALPGGRGDPTAIKQREASGMEGKAGNWSDDPVSRGVPLKGAEGDTKTWTVKKSVKPSERGPPAASVGGGLASSRGKEERVGWRDLHESGKRKPSLWASERDATES